MVRRILSGVQGTDKRVFYTETCNNTIAHLNINIRQYKSTSIHKHYQTQYNKTYYNTYIYFILL